MGALRTNPENLWRERVILPSFGSDSFLNFTSNDYFSLSKHPDVLNSVKGSLESVGLGSTGSPLLSGYSQHHRFLETLFCEKLGFDDALIYPSGYQANVSVLSTLLNTKSVVLTDRFVHASVIDGVRLGGAKLIRFSHNNVTHFIDLAKKHRPDLVVVDSIYSMQGDISPLGQIASICSEMSIPLMVDEAHGFGILGNSGLGSTDHWEFKEEGPDILSIPFGKALGVGGCIVLSAASIIENLVQKSRGYCYSTSISPLLCKAVEKSLLLVLEATPWRNHLKKLAQYLNKRAKEKGLPLLNQDTTPIRSFHVESSAESTKVAKTLQKNGVYVSNIRAPTVPKNQSLLRVSLNVNHCKEDIDSLIQCLEDTLQIIS